MNFEEDETASSGAEKLAPFAVPGKNVSANEDLLAFRASTAPKRTSGQVEATERAYAADVIDSVLGDWF